MKAATPLIAAFLIIALANGWPGDVRAWVYRVTGRGPLSPNGADAAPPSAPPSAPQVGPDPFPPQRPWSA